MKIVRTIEDIDEECWCRLTEENLNNLKKLGIKMNYDSFEEYSNKPEFDETDIFYIFYENKIFANWEDEDLDCNVPEIKFELEENIESAIDAKADFSDLLSQRLEIRNQISILENKLKEINTELIEKLKSEIN